jgi:hypothetical protein
MKKTTINLILIIVSSALSVNVYSQGYGYNNNFDVENINPYYESNYTPVSYYPNNQGYYPQQAQTHLIINPRHIIVNPFPVYPIARRGHIVRHIRRGQYYSRGCR